MAAINALGWKALTASVIDLKTPSTFVLDKVFGNVDQQEAETIEFDVVVGGQKLAPFVSPVQGGVVVKKLGYSTKTVKAPRIRIKKSLNANDFMEKTAGSVIYLSAGDMQKAKNKKIANEQLDLKDMVTRRTEWMACQALQGSITYTDENVSFNIDFGMPEDHKPVKTGDALWSNADHDIPKDIRDWSRLIAQKTGGNADIAIAGKNAVDAMLNNTKLLKLLDNRNVSIGNIVIDRNAGNAVTYIGRIEGVDIYEYNAQYVDPEDTVQDMIDADSFVMINTKAEFTRYYGAVLDLDAGGNVAVPFFSKDWTEKDPSAYWMLVESRPLPVPKRPEATVYATVL